VFYTPPPSGDLGTEVLEGEARGEEEGVASGVG
jgi:hypothetical protein